MNLDEALAIVFYVRSLINPGATEQAAGNEAVGVIREYAIEAIERHHRADGQQEDKQ
jgi:hypothetical protein